MANYHVGCGILGIYAGTLNEKGNMWLHKSDVTNEAFNAVAQYCLEHNEAMNFTYKGKRYRLSVTEINAGKEDKKCHNVGSDYAECDQFVCSNCGIELQDWRRVERDEDGDITYHEYTFNYCPNCGAKL